MSRGPPRSYKVDDDAEEEDPDNPFSFGDDGDVQLQRALKLSRLDYNSQYGLQDDIELQEVVTSRKREAPRAAAAAAAESRNRHSTQALPAPSSTGWISTTPNKDRPTAPVYASPVQARAPIRRLVTNNTSSTTANNTTTNNNNTGTQSRSMPSARKRVPVATAIPPPPALVNVSDDEEAEEKERHSGVAAPASPVRRRLLRRPQLTRGPSSVAAEGSEVTASTTAPMMVRLLPDGDDDADDDAAAASGDDSVGGRHARAAAAQHGWRRNDEETRSPPSSSSSSLPFEPDTSEGMVRPPIKTVAVATAHVPTGYASTPRTTAGSSPSSGGDVLRRRNVPCEPNAKSASKPHCRVQSERGEPGEPAPVLCVRCTVRCRTSPQDQHVNLTPCPLKYLPPLPPFSSPVAPPKLRQRDHHVGVVLADGVPPCLMRAALRGRLYCPGPGPDVCDDECRRLGLCEEGGGGGGDGAQQQRWVTRRRMMTQLLIRLHEWQRRNVLHGQLRVAALDLGPRHVEYPPFITAPPAPTAAGRVSTHGSSTAATAAAATTEDAREAWGHLLRPSAVTSPQAKPRASRPRQGVAKAPAVAGAARKARLPPSSRRRRDRGDDDDEDEDNPWFGHTTAPAISSTAGTGTSIAAKGGVRSSEARVQPLHRGSASSGRSVRRDGHGGTDEIEEFEDDASAHAFVDDDDDDDDDVVDLNQLTPPRKRTRRPVATANVHKRHDQRDVDDFASASASASAWSPPNAVRKRGLDVDPRRLSSPKRLCTSPMSRRSAEEIAMVAAGGVAPNRTARRFYGDRHDPPRSVPTAPLTLAEEFSSHDKLFDDEMQADSPDVGLGALDDSTEAESIEYAMPEMECPICGKLFPLGRIEQHADTCQGLVSVSDQPGSSFGNN